MPENTLAQEPARWGAELDFHTFSIVAVDRRTGESGVAVTTRNPCVGNAVPWVRAGVGAVATQGGTRVEYGPELLDLLAKGVAPKDAAIGPPSGRAPQEAVDAVDRFRAAQGWQTTVPGYVDARTIAEMWRLLEERGRASEIRKQLLDLLRIR